MREERLKRQRARVIQRLLAGEAPEAICASVNRSRSWLYKWLKRHLTGDADWNQRLSARPLRSPQKIVPDTEEVVKMIRLNLYNRDVRAGSGKKDRRLSENSALLDAAIKRPPRRAGYETTPTESHSSLQGQGGVSGHAWR